MPFRMSGEREKCALPLATVTGAFLCRLCSFWHHHGITYPPLPLPLSLTFLVAEFQVTGLLLPNQTFYQMIFWQVSHLFLEDDVILCELWGQMCEKMKYKLFLFSFLIFVFLVGLC